MKTEHIAQVQPGPAAPKRARNTAAASLLQKAALLRLHRADLRLLRGRGRDAVGGPPKKGSPATVGGPKKRVPQPQSGAEQLLTFSKNIYFFFEKNSF